MTLLSFMHSVTSTDKQKSTAATNTTVSVCYLIVLALALYLAFRDMGALPGTGPKVWLFLLAAAFPDLYVILHGLSSSSMGVGFFSDAMVDMHSMTPTHGASPASHGSSMAHKAAESVHKASEAAHKLAAKASSAVKRGAHSTASALKHKIHSHEHSSAPSTLSSSDLSSF